MSTLCQQKFDRLSSIVKEREGWRERIEQARRMRQWVLNAEHLLDGLWTDQEGATKEREPGEKEADKKKNWQVTNEQVRLRFDEWITTMTQDLTEAPLSKRERECLKQFLQVLSNARPFLIQCYDLAGFPRTNNEMEGIIRRVKARYRRISGRKNWNVYLLRYGRCIVFYEWWQTDPERWHQFEHQTQQIDPGRWRQMRKETTSAQSEQLKRFRHKREAYLCALENRWAAARSLLLP
jgi:hypothetical protein